MHNPLLQELVDRAEAYFDEELVFSKEQYKNILLKFVSPRFVSQFIDEAGEVPRRYGLKEKRFKRI